MCHRFIQEIYDNGGPDRSWKYKDSASFDVSTDGTGELEIVTPLADIIDDGDDGWEDRPSIGSLGDDVGVFSFPMRGRE